MAAMFESGMVVCAYNFSIGRIGIDRSQGLSGSQTMVSFSPSEGHCLKN